MTRHCSWMRLTGRLPAIPGRDVIFDRFCMTLPGSTRHPVSDDANRGGFCKASGPKSRLCECLSAVEGGDRVHLAHIATVRVIGPMQNRVSLTSTAPLTGMPTQNRPCLARKSRKGRAAPGHRARFRGDSPNRCSIPSTTPTYSLWNRCEGALLPRGEKCINAGVFHRSRALLPTHLPVRSGRARLSRGAIAHSGSSGSSAQQRRERGPATYPHSTRKLPWILQGPARPLCAGSTRDPQVKAPMLRL